MAKVSRSAKFGAEWTSNELLAYNVAVVEKNEQQFFGAPLPAYTGPAGFIQYEDRVQGIDKESLALLKRLDLATKRAEEEESAGEDFVSEVLRALGYETEQTVIRRRKSIRFNMCGKTVYAKANVCIQDINSNILLLLVQDSDPAHSEAQLVAGAIGAFQTNNANRNTNLFLPSLTSYVFPGITLTGTLPRFYKIKVTLDLDLAIQSAQYPEVKTVIERHTPRIPGSPNDGMKPLDNRIKILQCFEAFKPFVNEEEG